MSDDINRHPRAADRLVGHGGTERHLLELINQGRFPHAIIFSGVYGIGKATLAYRLARYLLAGESDGDSLSLASDHPVFRRVRSGGHGDLMTITLPEGKSVIPVDLIRQIGPFLRKTSAEGGWRIVIIDGADHMNHSAQNAILKLLEEPPSDALLLLTTDRPASLLATIRSRCRMMHLNSLSDDDMVKLMDDLIPDLDEDDRQTLLDLADGSIGRALNIVADNGLETIDDLKNLLADLPELNPIELDKFATKYSRKSTDTEYQLVTDFITRQLHLFIRGQMKSDHTTSNLPFQIRNQSDLKPWMDAWSDLNQQFERAEYAYLDRKTVLMNAILTCQKTQKKILSA
jgi:DNA polymerase-3 subunit delta'